MAPSPALYDLLLFTLLCTGNGEVSVSQTPLIQVTLAKEYVIVHCNASFPSRKDYAVFSFIIHRIDPQGQETFVASAPVNVAILPKLINTTQIEHQRFVIGPIGASYVTGNYYCTAKWASRSARGQGTFIHIRDTGYVANSQSSSRRLYIILISTCTFLTVLSLVGTGLLLLWRKKGYPTWSSLKARRANGGRKEGVTARPGRPEAYMPGSIYTSLTPHSIEVYDTIEQGSKIQSQEAKLSDPPQRLTIQQLKLEIKKSHDGQTGVKKTTMADAPQHPSTPKRQQERKKSSERQTGGKKTTTDVPEHPSTPKRQQERKKSSERQTGGKKTTTEVKQQTAAAQDEIFNMVYENL